MVIGKLGEMTKLDKYASNRMHRNGDGRSEDGVPELAQRMGDLARRDQMTRSDYNGRFDRMWDEYHDDKAPTWPFTWPIAALVVLAVVAVVGV